MVVARVNSILVLNTDIFLKRVRQLLYNGFYDSFKATHKVQGNRVYDLALSNDGHRLEQKNSEKLPSYLDPSPVMQRVAEVAFDMATTLWFDKAATERLSLESLIACGQFTTCYNLLKYIYNLKADQQVYSALSDDYKKRVEEIEQKLMTDYSQFKVDPYFLFNFLGEKFGVTGGKVLTGSVITGSANFPFIK